ncbi:MAG: MmgE/PrpD family protein [Chloroflexi bacterium]|nr:MmgE/PrpD family protein [Chloroflexota bacterium]
MKDRFQELFAAYAIAQHTLPADTIHEVKRRIIDSLGVMCAAINDDSPTAARMYAEQYPLQDGATIFGSTVRANPETAGFANGVAVRYLDFNDTYLSLEPLHPSDCIMPLLALAEWKNASAAGLIQAIAISYELSMNLCDAASLRTYGWDHVNYIGLGVAAGASRILGLNAAQTAHAISIALVPHAAMRQTRAGELSMWKGAAAANSARNGLFAALVASRGFTGPFEPFVGQMGFIKHELGGHAFDDKALERITRNEPPHRICDSYIKAYPVEYHAQSAVDAACELYQEIRDWRLIEQIEIETFKAAYEIIAGDPEKWKPTTRETADHSLQYIIAAGLVDGQVVRETFSPEQLRDERIHQLLSQTKLIESARLTAIYPESIPNKLTVKTKDGAIHTREARYPLGHAGNKMTDAQVVAKFRTNSARVWNDTEAEHLLDVVWKLENVASLRELTNRLPKKA